MKTLKEYVCEAEKKSVAIGHFNISNIEMVWAVFNAAKNLGVPVIVGVSEGEREFFGARQIVSVIKSLREGEDYPIFLNADHTYSFAKVKEAIDLGFDSVIFDGAKLSFEENVQITKQCVEYARKINPNVLVEAELGYIGQSSKVLDAIPEGVDLSLGLTTGEQAHNFVTSTGVDLFAPAVGNIHGMMRVGHDPRLHIDRIKNIKNSTKSHLVLHGGSGIEDEDFVKAIDAGKPVVYVPGIWRLIMLVIRLLPRFIMRRIGF